MAGDRPAYLFLHIAEAGIPSLLARIARFIDVGWGEFVRQLEYKAEWYGRTFIKIEKFYPSSKRCVDCGHILDSLTLDIRTWTCPECGVVHDRDVNAARNVLAAGLAVAAWESP